MVGWPDNKERRRAARKKTDFLLLYKVKEPFEVYIRVGKEKINALSRDLSQEGISILTQYELPVSTLVYLQFTLINFSVFDENERVRSIEASGEVRYNTPAGKGEYRVGIAFTRISKDNKESIADFLKAASSQ